MVGTNLKNRGEVEMAMFLAVSKIRNQIILSESIQVRDIYIDENNPLDNLFQIRFRLAEDDTTIHLNHFVDCVEKLKASFAEELNATIDTNIPVSKAPGPNLYIGSRYYDDPAEIYWTMHFRVVKWDLFDELLRVMEEEKQNEAAAKRAANRLKKRLEAKAERELYDKLKAKYEK